jgi:group I intron endonuclease
MAYGYIYVIENNRSGKSYVGQARDPDKRRREHFRGSPGCPYLKAAIEKYGNACFDFVLLEACSSQEELNRKEQYWIAFLGTEAPSGYNLTRGGEGMPSPSKETRDKLSKAKRGKNSPWWGKSLSEKHKEKLRKAKLGKPLSESHRRNLGKAHKGLFAGEKHPLYGKPVSDETRQKLSMAAKGRKLSPEHKRKIGEANRRRWIQKNQTN